jgi:hypothetical protein
MATIETFSQSRQPYFAEQQSDALIELELEGSLDHREEWANRKLSKRQSAHTGLPSLGSDRNFLGRTGTDSDQETYT